MCDKTWNRYGKNRIIVLYTKLNSRDKEFLDFIIVSGRKHYMTIQNFLFFVKRLRLIKVWY